MKKQYLIVIICMLFMVASIPQDIVSSGSITESPWPAFSKDYQQTGYTDIQIAGNDGKITWMYDVGDRVYSSPVIDSEGNVYFGAQDGLYSINKEGILNWIFKTDGISGYPTIDENNHIYFGTHLGEMYSISPEGEEIWGFQEPNYTPLSSPPVIYDGYVYIVSPIRGELFSFDKSNGAKQWNIYFHPQPPSFPALGKDGLIYSSTSSTYGTHYTGSTYAFYPTNGTIKFEFTPEKHDETITYFSTHPIIASDGSIYVGFQNHIYSLNNKGDIIWKTQIEQITYHSPSVDIDGNLFVGTENGLVVLSSEGEELWNIEMKNVSTPALSGDGYVVIGADKSVYAINTITREIVWKSEINNDITSPAIDVDGSIYVLTKDGVLYAIGEEVETRRIPFLTISTYFVICMVVVLYYQRKKEGDPHT